METPTVEPKVRHAFVHGDPYSGLPGKPAFLVGWVRDPVLGQWYGQVVTVNDTGTSVQIHWVHADLVSTQERLHQNEANGDGR
ncbi:MAG: hypothetical protein JWP74_3481 [Marmoricola sp.]|nr:hypothetical protein [Marmoricola sp.]